MSTEESKVRKLNELLQGVSVEQLIHLVEADKQHHAPAGKPQPQQAPTPAAASAAPAQPASDVHSSGLQTTAHHCSSSTTPAVASVNASVTSDKAAAQANAAAAQAERDEMVMPFCTNCVIPPPKFQRIPQIHQPSE